MDGPALPGIVRELERVEWLDQIVVSLGRADRHQFEEAQRFFASLGSRWRILWIEGPKVQECIRVLAEHGLDIGGPGKGRGTWLAMGHVLASGAEPASVRGRPARGRLVVDTNQIDFVKRKEDLEDLIRQITRPFRGTQFYVPRGSR